MQHNFVACNLIIATIEPQSQLLSWSCDFQFSKEVDQQAPWDKIPSSILIFVCLTIASQTGMTKMRHRLKASLTLG